MRKGEIFKLVSPIDSKLLLANINNEEKAHSQDEFRFKVHVFTCINKPDINVITGHIMRMIHFWPLWFSGWLLVLKDDFFRIQNSMSLPLIICRDFSNQQIRIRIVLMHFHSQFHCVLQWWNHIYQTGNTKLEIIHKLCPQCICNVETLVLYSNLEFLYEFSFLAIH